MHRESADDLRRNGLHARLATGYAKVVRLDPVLADRDAAALAGMDGETLAFTLDDPAAIDAALSGVTVLLNCAGLSCALPSR